MRAGYCRNACVARSCEFSGCHSAPEREDGSSVSDTGQAGRAGTSQQPPRPVRGKQDQSRLLPLLAAERLLRAVVLVGVGLIVLTHAHADWMGVARDFAARAGLDPMPRSLS
jgi:glyoxylase-like metal-dependent hydrolase (beta-lactamase superfamily II)